ncbi:MAG TPA: hypothetical protein VLA24_09460 [Pseudomonadales bacterium]|nr:hypothetical protein [Pseudomonadales bacterium]
MEIWTQIEQEFNCNHARCEPVRFIKSNGAVCVRIQCLDCGESQGEKKKANYNITELSNWNEELKKQSRDKRRQRAQELHNQQFLQREQLLQHEQLLETVEWWKSYSQYLQTTEWHTIRRLVLDRDSHICQACLRNKAAHVHHLSYTLYNQIGRSAAFELVAICRPCHEKIHPHMSHAQDLEIYHNPYLEKVTLVTT